VAVSIPLATDWYAAAASGIEVSYFVLAEIVANSVAVSQMRKRTLYDVVSISVRIFPPNGQRFRKAKLTSLVLVVSRRELPLAAIEESAISKIWRKDSVRKEVMRLRKYRR
jgi:hypothetical protein